MDLGVDDEMVSHCGEQGIVVVLAIESTDEINKGKPSPTPALSAAPSVSDHS